MGDNDTGATVPNLLDQAATATQGMIPGQKQNLTAFGSAPMVQPPPIPRFQAPQPQFAKAGNEFQTVSGRKRADRQAVINGAASLIKAGTDYIQANKQRALQMDIEKLMEASQGRVEAQQALQQDPNNQEAKVALERNTGIINLLTKDPKKAKQFQKAFNIDLFGNGKNKTENAALAAAMAEWQKKQQAGDKTTLNPIAQRLEQMQPQRLGLDPQSQAQAQAIKAGLIPKAGEILKANVDVFNAYQTAQTGAERAAAIENAAKVRAQAEEYNADKVIDAANIRAGGMKYAADVRSRAEIYKANKVSSDWDKRLKVISSIADDKNTDEKTKTILGSVSKDITTDVTRLKDLAADNAKLYNTLDKKGSTIIGGIKFDANNPADVKRMHQQIGRNNAEMRDTQNNLQDSRRQLQTLQGMGIISLTGGGDTGGEGTQDRPLPPPPDDNGDEPEE